MIYFTTGAAGGIPAIAAYVKGFLPGSGVLVHEIGHCLGLYHTFRGSEGFCEFRNPGYEDTDPASYCDTLSGNLYECGDCVPDTPTDPWMYAGDSNGPYDVVIYDPITQTCSVNPLQPFPDVDIHNYMSYYIGCYEHFTPGQVARMKKAVHFVQYNLDGTIDRDYRFLQGTLSDKLVITANTTWDEPVEVCTDVYIEAPNTLTITSTASIHQGLKFVVKPGAQLRLEGGVMTDAGDGYWKGIEVWGDGSGSQNLTTGQGKLYMGGGAVIEFATEAIVAFNPSPAGGDVEATAGGLVLAFDSYFRNNARSVEFRRYDGQNYGHFVNCEFTIDGGHYGHPFREHVKLNGVRGLHFINCLFSNDTGPGDVFLGKGAGIHSLDANFTVGGSGTVFQKLRFGVKAGSAKGAEGFMVKDATFRELEKGVLASAANHFTVTRCTLYVGGHVSNLPPFLVSQEGVQINYSTGFTVMGNRLRGLAASQDETVGVKVIDTGGGTDANTIYGNNFDVLYVGNAAVGDNVGRLEGGGIVYECNFNLGSNVFDFWVQEGEGITEDQRSVEGEAAGNTFSQNGGNPEGDFNNQGSFINYFYYDDEGDPNNPPDAGQEPLFYTESTILKLPEDFNDCSNGETGGEIPDEEISLVKNRFFDAKGQYQLYKADYDELIDNGDTPGLLAEVNQAGASEANSLANDMLAIAPYVSQHVLKAVVDKPAVFDNSLQVDLLEANPEAVRKAGFLLYLEENSSLDGEELSQVQQASLLNTDRDAMEEDLSAAYANMHRSADLVLAHYLLDSLAYNRDSALLWLAYKGSLHSLYLKADILLQAGQGEAAQATLSSIPEAFLLTGKQQEEYDNKLALFQLLSGQADLFKMDSLDVAELSAIAQSGGQAGQQARNLLNYAYEGEWEPDHSLPEPAEARLTNIAPEHKEPLTFIRAFPNPAREVVTFHYNIPEAVVATVRLFNLMGRPVADVPLQPRSGARDFDVSALPEGMYAYQLLLGGMVKAAGKVVVLH